MGDNYQNLHHNGMGGRSFAQGPLVRPPPGPQQMARAPVPANQAVMNTRPVQVRPQLQPTPAPQRTAPMQHQAQQASTSAQGNPQGQVKPENAAYRQQIMSQWGQKHRGPQRPPAAQPTPAPRQVAASQQLRENVEMPRRRYRMEPMDVALADTHNHQRALGTRQHQMDVMGAHRQQAFDPSKPGTSRQHSQHQAPHRQLAFDPSQPGTSRQYAQHQGPSIQPVYNQFYPQELHARRQIGAQEQPSTSNTSRPTTLEEMFRMTEGNERSQEYDEDAEDNEKVFQNFRASSSRNHSGAEEKGVEDLVKEFRSVGEEMGRRNSGPSAEQSIQPPSISPQSNHIPGARPPQHQQEDVSPQAPPSIHGTYPTPPNFPTPPNPQVFAPMPPHVYIPHHLMQQVQHFVYPPNQEDHNVIVQRLQDRMMDYANQVRLKDGEIQILKNEVEMKDQEIGRLRKELEAASATQNTSSSLPFHVPLAPSASVGPSATLKRGAADNVAEIPEKVCRVKEEPRDSERWVEETPEEAWRNHVQMMMKKEPEDVQHPVPQPSQFFPFPFQHAVVGQQPIQLLPNSAFSTSDVIVDNYFQRLAPQRIQTFDVALEVWTHRFSEPLLNRIVRQRPGQGFELWGLKIQNLNFAPFLFNPQSQSKQVPQLVKKILVKPKCFYDFLHGFDKDSSDFTRLNADEKGKWKAFKEVLTEFVTEQFQAGLIFRPGMKPE